MEEQVRSVFISDTHLGHCYARTDLLLEFLHWILEVKPDRLYIVGDFIDGWKLKRSWSWDARCNLVIQKMLKLSRKGTEIFYVAGNHDEFLRDFLHPELSFGDIHIKDEFIHQGVNGDKYLVIHGDQFDTAIRYAMSSARWLCSLGDLGYNGMIRINGFINAVRKFFGMPYWSFSKAVKQKFKQAVNYVGGFENLIANYAKERNCQGVICGHIHHCNVGKINDVNYVNCGDWVESCTAIIEYRDGSIKVHNALSI